MTEKKILLVDDDITSLDIVSVLFEKKGYEVIRTAGGKKAIEVLEELTPDLVLLDLMMPEYNGVEAMQEIRSRGIKVPVIAFTASNDPCLHDLAVEAGCIEVVTKPCRSRVLLEIVEKSIAG
jgi:two-component system response regulator VicR